MIDLLLRILFPEYVEYQELMNKQISELESESVNNER